MPLSLSFNYSYKGREKFVTFVVNKLTNCMITLGVIGGWEIAIILVILLIPFLLVVLLVAALRKKNAHRMPCPYCGESIVVGAQKCRFCGEWLTGRGAKQVTPPAKSQKSNW
jgi:hypothetical protein